MGVERMADPARRGFPRGVAELRRYHLVGGLAAWRVPVLFGLLLLSASVAGEWALAGLLGLLGLIIHTIERSAVLEVSASGLSQGHMRGGSVLGSARVFPWRGITRIHTRWRGAHDRTALDTILSGPLVGSITVSTTMGVGPYRALIEDVSHHAPWADHTGLTRQLLAEAGRPRRGGSRVARAAEHSTAEPLDPPG